MLIAAFLPRSIIRCLPALARRIAALPVLVVPVLVFTRSGRHGAGTRCHGYNGGGLKRDAASAHGDAPLVESVE